MKVKIQIMSDVCQEAFWYIIFFWMYLCTPFLNYLSINYYTYNSTTFGSCQD